VTSVVVLDVETTGKDRAVDQVIELCLQLGAGAGDEARTWRIRPSVPIHPEATKVHGITAEDLSSCLPFGDVAAEFLPLIEEADVIIGYNVSFDLDMLQAEFSRMQIPPLELGRKQIVDVLRLWHHVEPRTLVAAHQKFCGEALVDAHQATADVAATARVLSAMRATFGLEDRSWPELASISDPFSGRATWLGPSLHIQWDASGAVVFGFGKHKGCQVDQVDAGFLRWVLAKDFPPHVKKICQVALERRRQFQDWISQYYPRPEPMQEESSVEVPQESSVEVPQEAIQVQEAAS
jgi:DNA polymerase-3 subunit epsilon